MALVGLLATRKATENSNIIEATGAVKCMVSMLFVTFPFKSDQRLYLD